MQLNVEMYVYNTGKETGMLQTKGLEKTLRKYSTG